MRNRFLVVANVAGIALALVAVFGPWWVLSTGPVSGPSEFAVGYGPFGWSVLQVASNGTVYQTIAEPGSGIPPFWLVLYAATALVAAGIAAAAVAVVLGSRSPSKPSRPKRRVYLEGLAFALLLAAPLEVMLFLPIALSAQTPGYPGSGFWGSRVTGHASGLLAWGAGWGWYVAVAAALCLLVGTIVMLRSGGRSTAPPAPPAL